MINNDIDTGAIEEQQPQQQPTEQPPGQGYLNRDELGSIFDEAVARWSADIDRRFKQMREEEEKLANMSPAERGEYDRERIRQELDSRQADIAKRESEIVRRELRADAIKTLGDMGLPAELAEIIDYSDRDTCDKSISAVEKAFRSAVRAGVDDRLRQSRVDVFRNSAAIDSESLSDEDFYRIRFSK